MLVIGTHNGNRYLLRCIESLDKFGHPLPVLVVDTNSDDQEHLKTLNYIAKKYTWVTVETSKYGQYELGSIRHAYFEHHPDHLLFIHDSMAVKEHNWWEPFELRLKEAQVVPWITFSPVNYDNQWQESFIRRVFGIDIDYNYIGIFGSCFCATATAMDKIHSKGWLDFECTNKNMSQAMERAWPLAFRDVGMRVFPVFPMNIFNVVRLIESGRDLFNNPIPCFEKTILGRG